MKARTDLIHSTSKSTLGFAPFPDSYGLNSSNQSSKNLSLPKNKSTKSSERLVKPNDSPFGTNKKNMLLKTKESSRIIKIAAKGLSKKDLKPIELFPIKSTKSQNSLPKLNVLYADDSSKPSIFNPVLKYSPKRQLKHINISEELKLNENYLSGSGEYKFGSWLENLVKVKDWDIENQDLLGSLKFCNKLIRDIMLRLKSSGKENESVLLQKIWSKHFEILDEYIEEFDKKLVECENNAKRVVKEMIKEHDEKSKEMEIKILEAESKVKFENNFERIWPIVEKVRNRVEELTESLNESIGNPRIQKKLSFGKSLLIDKKVRIKNKQSMDILQNNILERAGDKVSLIT